MALLMRYVRSYASWKIADTSNLKKAFDGSSNLTKKQPSSRMKRHASVDNPTLSSIGGRDPALDTFHAIGKILYCKRQEDLLLKTRSVDVRFRRPPLISNPDEVLSRISMSGDSFTCFLHQSYPDFFSKLDDLAEAADHFSIADPFFHEWAVSDSAFEISEVKDFPHSNSFPFRTPPKSACPSMGA